MIVTEVEYAETILKDVKSIYMINLSQLYHAYSPCQKSALILYLFVTPRGYAYVMCCTRVHVS